jgi:hypothetical protein
MSDIKRIDIAEFRRLGYLQELNRQFLHPLGLALEVVVEDDGSEYLGGVWDYRDDPEGMCFGDFNEGCVANAERIRDEFNAKAMTRKTSLGYVVQPVEVA